IGLGRIQDVRVTSLLIEILTDPDRNVKRQAIQALGGLRDDRAKQALQEVAANRRDRELSTLAKQLLTDM
ncbi:MAG TPA: HEAT repeat domain-containing protein, partial [Anaerolineales bacterium]|nr:HEAT repeat domain-containing protein [Anaerolineales bacterium]